jgi:hypothetical protein
VTLFKVTVYDTETDTRASAVYLDDESIIELNVKSVTYQGPAGRAIAWARHKKLLVSVTAADVHI